MNNKNENPTDSFILQEKKYIEEDRKLIKCIEDCLCVLQERYTLSKESYRIKNSINTRVLEGTGGISTRSGGIVGGGNYGK